MGDLLSCPFCGGNAAHRPHSNTCAEVGCLACGAVMQMGLLDRDWRKTEAALVWAWNRRVDRSLEAPIIRAARALDACASEFGLESGCCGEHLDALWTACDRYREMRRKSDEPSLLSGGQEDTAARSQPGCVPSATTSDAEPSAKLHPATRDLVDRFAAALAEKLARAEQKYGYSDGWARSDWQDECRRQLHHHAAKGDPRDVAAYAAFCWHHGWPTTLPSTMTDEEARKLIREAAELIRTDTVRAAAHDLHAALKETWRVLRAAGLLNLSNGVQLGQTSWYVKICDAEALSDAAVAKATPPSVTRGATAPEGAGQLRDEQS